MIYSGFCSKCLESVYLAYRETRGDAIPHMCVNCGSDMRLVIDVKEVDMVA